VTDEIHNADNNPPPPAPKQVASAPVEKSETVPQATETKV